MEDKKTILKLYKAFMEEIYEATEEETEISKQVSKLQDKLWKTMTKEQKRILDNIYNCKVDIANEISKQAFIYAFSLATQLFTESLIKEEQKNRGISN